MSFAADVAWLHHVHGLSQAEIADRRGLSRMKVHRLLQQAYESGIVRIFIDRVPTFCAELEAGLIDRFGLTSCVIVPDAVPAPSMFDCMAAVSSAGAMFLHGMLESTEARTIGIGSGRTMAATVRAMPTLSRPATTFVSLTGDFAVLNNANPFEVINTLIQKTGGKGNAFTAPLIVETKEDRELFLRQRAVAGAMALVEQAEFFFTGLGNVGENSFFDSYGLVTKPELEELKDLDIAADISGNLVNSKGEFIVNGLAQRMLGVKPSELRTHKLIMVAGGVEKSKAAIAALRTGCVNGLITDEVVARIVLENT